MILCQDMEKTTIILITLIYLVSHKYILFEKCSILYPFIFILIYRLTQIIIGLNRFIGTMPTMAHGQLNAILKEMIL